MASEEIQLSEHRHLESLQEMEVIKTVTADYTPKYYEDIILGDTTAGNVTITLPLARGGHIFHILKIKAANTLTIVFTGTETMLGVASLSITDFGAGKRLKSVPNGYIPL